MVPTGATTSQLPAGVALGASSETAPLRAVMLHRPGEELSRLTPRNSDQLLFDALPWVARAQAEHDAFAQLLRSRGVAVYLLGELLAETIAVSGAARIQGISAAVSARRLGLGLAEDLSAYLRGLPADELARILTGGMTFDELPGAGSGSERAHFVPGAGSDSGSLVRMMHHGGDFAIAPLPNLLFTRDSSFWIGRRFAITSLALAARERESSLTDLIYAHHPMFAGARRAYESQIAPVEGGDVLLLAPGVVAVGVGERTTPAGAESLARSLFADDLAHTVLAVPIAQERAFMHLDTVCTMVDRDAVVMYPEMHDGALAYPMRLVDGEVRVDDARPFLDAAADAMGIEQLRVIDTGLDPVTAEREQWDDGNNTLALEPGVVVAYNRTVETNKRLIDAGIEVLEIEGGELGSGRGGPRCMSCPLARD